MKRTVTLSLLFLFAATMAFGHAGEVHTYLGTITSVNTDGSFVMKMTSGKDRTVLVSKATTYTRADGGQGQHSDLVVGRRIAAKISEDGKTALNVKLGARGKTD